RWTGRNPDSGLIHSPFDSIRNLLVDPNANSWDDVQGVARRRTMPKWQAKKLMPKYADAIQNIAPSSRRESDIDSKYDWEKSDTAVECITFYEIWFKVGVHNFAGGDALVKDQQSKDQNYAPDDAPKKYFIHETGMFLGVDNWEVPFFMRGMWPCEVVGYYGNPDSIWNVSPLEPGLGYQRAMNWIVTLLIGKYRYTSKTLLAIKKQNGQGLKDGDLDKILIGGDIDAIQIDIKGEKKSIKDFIERFDYGSDFIGAGLMLLDAIERKFEMATGMYGVLYSGEGSAQSRSARDAEMKDKNSHTRIQDMQSEVAAWERRIAKKEDFASSFLVKREDLIPLLGEEAAQAWGYLVPEGQQLPQAIMQEMSASLPPGFPPEQLQAFAIQEAAQRFTMSEIAMDTDYDVESASSRRKDVNSRIDSMKELCNQVVPMQIQSLDPAEKALAYVALKEYYKLIGAEDEVVQKMDEMAKRLTEISMMPQPAAPQPAEEK
nr:hypothetical protein [Gemmatimonadaceae bacterium]